MYFRVEVRVRVRVRITVRARVTVRVTVRARVRWARIFIFCASICFQPKGVRKKEGHLG